MKGLPKRILENTHLDFSQSGTFLKNFSRTSRNKSGVGGGTKTLTKMSKNQKPLEPFLKMVLLLRVDQFFFLLPFYKKMIIKGINQLHPPKWHHIVQMEPVEQFLPHFFLGEGLRLI